MASAGSRRNSAGLWGAEETKYFYAITPERILSAVEAYGLRCTGRCLSLHSLENRVYEVEVELPAGEQQRSVSERFRVVKFYRPGRWSREQILEEHEFLEDLAEAELPVVPPISFEGETLRRVDGMEMYCALFPRAGGRSPAELNEEQLKRVGRLLARLHQVGAAKRFACRLALTPAAYGIENLRFMVDNGVIMPELVRAYSAAVDGICDLCAPWFEETPAQRVHGDAHLGNLLWRDEALAVVDFDDCVLAPRVQDLWLMVQGRDDAAQRRMEILLEGYEEMSPFDRSSLRLIEALRALRMIHYSAWIAHRREDPAFRSVFPHFGGQQYWMEQVADLQEQLEVVRSGDAWRL